MKTNQVAAITPAAPIYTMFMMKKLSIYKQHTIVPLPRLVVIKSSYLFQIKNALCVQVEERNV